MKSFKQDFIQSVKIIILALFIAVGTSYIFAWTAPTGTPPAGDVSAPINVGYSPQIKDGNLWIKGLVSAGVSATNGLIVENGNVGIGNTAPVQKLDVTGQIHATGDICTDAGGGKCLSTGGSNGGELITRTCTNAQSLSGGSQAVAACVAAVNSNNTWRAINCKRPGVTATEVTGGDFLNYSGGKWFITLNTGGPWTNLDCVDGSVVIVKVNATSGGMGGCYVSYSGSCLSGFINQGSAGTWGTCYRGWNDNNVWFRPAGATCPTGSRADVAGDSPVAAAVCCK